MIGRRALALGVGAMVLGAPSAAGARTLELEGGKLTGERAGTVRDPGASAGRAVALSGRGYVRRRFTPRSRITSVLLRARGESCAGAPRLTVSLDGRRVSSIPVRSQSFRRLRVRLRPRRPAKRVLVLGLANPRRSRTCARRLVLDTLSFAGKASRPRAPRVTPAPPRHRAAAPAAAAPPAAVAPPAPPAPPPPAYQNPVFSASGSPDPMVLDVGANHSEYLAFATGNRFPILRSPDLRTWAPAGEAFLTRPAWATRDADWNPWAPSVIERPGPCPGMGGTRCFVLFHVAKHRTFVPTMNCIGVAVSANAAGPYTALGPLENKDGSLDANGRPPGCSDDRGYSNIDPAPFVDDDGRAYLYLSTGRRCDSPPAPGAQCTFNRAVSMIELDPDLLSAIAPRVALFEASAPWETAPFGPVVENPWMAKRGDTYHLLYSGGAYDGPYGMGYATSASPAGPFTKATENPFLREANGVISVGGGMVVNGPKGFEWLVYHGRQDNYDAPRNLRIDRLHLPPESAVTLDGPTSAPQATAP